MGEVLEVAATNPSTLLAVIALHHVNIFFEVVSKRPGVYHLHHSVGLMDSALCDSFIVMY